MADGPSCEAAPLATPTHEETAKQVFGGWDVMSPEEWAARYSHTVGCSSFDQYRYRDAELQAWIYELHAILGDPARVRACREKFLTPEQIADLGEYEF